MWHLSKVTQYGIASHDGPLFSCMHLFCFDLFFRFVFPKTLKMSVMVHPYSKYKMRLMFMCVCDIALHRSAQHSIAISQFQLYYNRQFVSVSVLFVYSIIFSKSSVHQQTSHVWKFAFSLSLSRTHIHIPCVSLSL